MVKERLSICSDSLQSFQVRIFEIFSLLIIKKLFLKSTLRYTLKTHKQYFRSLGTKGFNCEIYFLGLYQTLYLDLISDGKKKSF